jgi:hypothetical protein
MTTPPTTNHPPSLWNPNAAANWSLLFSPAFGAFLHARNAEALGRADEAKANRKWFFASMSYFGLVFVSDFFPAIPDALFRAVAFGLLFGWYFSLGRKQITYVKKTWPDGYQRKPLTMPLLIAFGSLVALFIAIFILGMATELLLGSD